MKVIKTSKARILLAIMIFFITTVLLATLQSCDENDDNIDSDIIKDNNLNIQDSIPVKTQETTNKLTIYGCFINEGILVPAINIFKEKYPNVEIEYREFENMDEYYQILRTELAAGKGPDLIVTGDQIDNIYKTMDAGIFADINPFIENDGGFNWDDYNKVVLDAGIYKGKRYVMPLDYSVPLLITTQEILDEEKIKPSDLTTFEGYINTVNSYNEKYKDNPRKSISQKLVKDWEIINYIFPWCSIDLINYSTKKIDIDNPHFKSVMDAGKWAYVSKKDNSTVSISGADISIPALQNKEWLFDFKDWSNIEDFINMQSLLREKQLTPVFFTYPDTNDKTTARVQTFAAIPKASKNQINAYNLLKILLSEEIQVNARSYGYGVTYMPVLKSGIKTIFEQIQQLYVQELGMKAVPEQETNMYMDMMINVDSCKLMEITSYYDFLVKDIAPYYEGTQSFEQFVKKLKNDLELYISE